LKNLTHLCRIQRKQGTGIVGSILAVGNESSDLNHARTTAVFGGK
jgi:hypothetical protein